MEGRPRVAVTGAAAGFGRALAARLAARADVADVVAVDQEPGDLTGVTWRPADVRDPLLRTRLAGVDVVVHLATATSPDAPEEDRRALNVRGTAAVLRESTRAGVRRVVLVTSAMVYGARADNPLPLTEDDPLRAEADRSLVGDWIEMERLAARAAHGRGAPQVAVLRPATVVGPGADSVLTRYFDAPRLLVIRGSEPCWQFCHVDDLLTALELAVFGGVTGPVNVAADGFLTQDEVEQVVGARRVVLPASVAFGAAERLHRLGVIRAPAAELGYLSHRWVVSCDRLRAAGWRPMYDNTEALRAHLAFGADRDLVRRLAGRPATRAAAGATLAVVGAAALARARRARRR